MTNTIRAAALIVLAAAGAGCSTTRAAIPVERPALDVPPVPPRIVEPVAVTVVTMPEPVPDLPPPTAGGNTRQKPATAPAKPDPKVETPPADPPPDPPAAPPSVPPLRSPGTGDAAEETRRINEITGRAQGILDKTHYQSLTEERKSQYQHTQLLISQANDAIKAKNFQFARNLAEKAERLARELHGR